MTTEKTDAIVIRQADFSETSRVVTFFTREHGKMAALAKGAKRLKGPFEAAIDLLAACRIVFIHKSTGSLDLLTEAQLIERFTPNGRDLNSLYGGYYVAELLSSLTEDFDPHPELYDEAFLTLKRLSSEQDHKLILLKFELSILREIGQLPMFDACMVCNQPVEEASTRFGFSVSQGGVICRECQQQESQAQPEIQPGTLAVLRRLTLSGEESSRNFVISDQQYAEMRKIVTSAVRHVLGRPAKMSRYLRL